MQWRLRFTSPRQSHNHLRCFDSQYAIGVTPWPSARHGFERVLNMATSYLAPGVYIEEVPSANQTIAAVGTNTAGFIGVVDDTIKTLELLPDGDFQKNLNDALEKSYGSDFSDAAIKVKIDKATQDLAGAQQPVTDAGKDLGKAKEAMTKATAKVAAAASDADKAAATAEARTAEGVQTRAQAALDAATDKAKVTTASLQKTLDSLNALLKLSPSERQQQAKQDIRSSVPRYKPVEIAISVPAGQAKLCTNFTEYQARFGDWSAYDDPGAGNAKRELSGHQILSHAVYDFFNNGGSRCFVARVRPDSLADDLDTALRNFESIEAISLVAFPGKSADKTISGALVAHCEKTKYRFAILDAPASPVDDKGYVDFQQLTFDGQDPILPGKSKHAALYFPYVQMVDSALQRQQAAIDSIPTREKGMVFVPPSGAIAGIYARTDVQRGVFKAPANASVLGAQNVKYYISRSAQEGLNPQGVNCIRTLNGDVTVWGARTCGGDDNGEWRYVSVRRTFLFIAKSIDEGTQWVVFEPNDPSLWGKVRRNVSAFLTTVWRDGALFGTVPEEAFYVKCDAENNPPETREVGRLVIEVGIAIVRPAEFVIFRITQGTAKTA